MQRYPDVDPTFLSRCCIQSGEVLQKLSKQQQDPEFRFLFVVYENERFVPGRGWSSKHLSPRFFDPFQLTGNDGEGNYDFNHADSKPGILPAAEWSWSNDWKLANEHCDEGGWQYQTSFWSRAMTSSSSSGKCVRRRRWQRQMRFTQTADQAPCISLPVAPQREKSTRLRTKAGHIDESYYLSHRILVATSRLPSIVAAEYGEQSLRDLLLTKGKWYFEVEVLEKGTVQLGWAKPDFRGE
jgi:hypothetical protein